MKILLVGGGGREHAMAWKIRQSPLCEALFVAPGNPGTAQLGINLQIKATDFETLGNFCSGEKIDLMVVGPEAPLVEGIRDYFESNLSLRHIGIVGPGKVGAQLEGSKDFSKAFMLRHGIPTAGARTFSDSDSAVSYIEKCKTPIVIKADGLAAGKGVIITSSREEAAQTVKEILDKKRFGDAGSKLLIEEFLTGTELSVFVLTDGEHYVILPEAKDYKRIGDGDQGPNTGGMGAVSPVVFADAAFMKKVEEKIIAPTIKGLKVEGIPYRGFIFFGLINVMGEPFVIEYNARMGDPETQSVMLRLKSDLVPLLQATAKGTLKGLTAEFHSQYAVTISMVAEGYPGDYKKGIEIQLGECQSPVFHAGTKLEGKRLLTEGGRVISATGMGATIEEAALQAYQTVSSVKWDGVYFRKDIGKDLLNWKG